MINGIIDSNQKIVSDGLVLNLDVAQLRSYPTTGTTWTDLSGQGNNGTLVNGVAYDSGNGGSLVFDGVNDYVTLSNTFSNPTTLSICVFLKITSVITPGVVYGYRSGITELIQLTIQNNSTAFFQIRGSGNTILNISGNITLNTILMLTGVFNKNTGNHFLYVNNIDSSGNIDLTGQTLNSTLQTIGSTNNGSYVAPFNGNIYQVQIYNRALSATEVLQNYNANKSRYGL